MEVGANTTIDRGSTRDTIIGAGTRIDNLVQIGHNVQLGRCCVIAAQVGIAGSTILEDFVQVGGQGAMAGHLRIGQASQIGAQAGVISGVPAGSALLGSLAQPRKEFFRQVAALRRMQRRPGSAPLNVGAAPVPLVSERPDHTRVRYRYAKPVRVPENSDGVDSPSATEQQVVIAKWRRFFGEMRPTAGNHRRNLCTGGEMHHMSVSTSHVR